MAAMRSSVGRLAPRMLGTRMLGAGYTGAREAGYDEAAMSKMRAWEDQPFFMLNLLKIKDFEGWMRYQAASREPFIQLARGELVYAGGLRESLVPIAGIGIDTSDYNLLLLVKYPSSHGFFAFIDSPAYQAAYPYRHNALKDGKSALITSFPLMGTATEDIKTKAPAVG